MDRGQRISVTIKEIIQWKISIFNIVCLSFSNNFKNLIKYNQYSPGGSKQIELRSLTEFLYMHSENKIQTHDWLLFPNRPWAKGQSVLLSITAYTCYGLGSIFLFASTLYAKKEIFGNSGGYKWRLEQC